MNEEAKVNIARAICREVAELPDRNSPDNWPDAMLVTAPELEVIVIAALAAEPHTATEEAVRKAIQHSANLLGSTARAGFAQPRERRPPKYDSEDRGDLFDYPGRLYEHYKGGYYVFLGHSLLEADKTPMTTYISLKDGQYWTRPTAEFREKFKRVLDVEL